MRSPDYVAIVVSIYRKALDAVAAGTFVHERRTWMILPLHSRVDSSGYLCGDRGPSLMGRDQSDNGGLYRNSTVCPEIRDHDRGRLGHAPSPRVTGSSGSIVKRTESELCSVSIPCGPGGISSSGSRQGSGRGWICSPGAGRSREGWRHP